VPIVLIGFCFGGWVVGKASGEDAFRRFNIIGGINCHPSWLVEGYFHCGSEKSVADRVNYPQLFLPAGNDSKNLFTDGKIPKILHANGLHKTKSVVFEDMIHGWIARGCGGDRKIQDAQKKALDESCSFIKSVLQDWKPTKTLATI